MTLFNSSMVYLHLMSNKDSTDITAIIMRQNMEPQSDDEMMDEISEELELSKMDLSELMSQEVVENQICIGYPRSMEEMLIYYKHYRQKIESICIDNGVRVIMGMEKFNLYGNEKRQIQGCYRQLERQLFDRMIMVNIELKDWRDLRKYMQSPWRNKLLQQKGCHLTLYQQNILILDSLRQSKTDLEQIKKSLSVAYTQRIVFRCPLIKSRTDASMGQYFNKVIEKQKPSLDQCKVTMQVGLTNDSIFVMGNDTQSRIAGKNTARKIINQAVCLIFKTQERISINKLREYLTEIVKNPWVADEVEKDKKYVVITKDAVWLHLLLKESFQKRVGLDKDTIVGIMTPLKAYNPLTMNTDSELINKICEDQGYRRQIDYKDACYIEKSDKPLRKYVQFLKNVIQEVSKTRQNYKFGIAKLKSQLKQDKQGSYKPIKTFYQQAGTIPLKDTSDLRQQFGCDFTMIKLLMNQKYSITYNSMEGTQRKNILFTIEEQCNPTKTKEVKIEFQKMSGKYYYGRVKSGDDGTIKYMPDFLIVTM